jgi:possible N-acetylmuramoyl-L-alanine amidase
LIITKEYKHNETRDGKKASKQTKEMKKIAKKSKNKLSIGQILPRKLG